MSNTCPESIPKWRRLLTIWTLIIFPLKISIGYWAILYNYVFLKKKFSEIAPTKDQSSNSGYFSNDLPAHVHIYSLSLVYKMWNYKHYRNDTYQTDLLANLKNLAIPGTGIPLSLFCANRFLALFLIVFINPLVCFISAIYLTFIKFSSDYNSLNLKKPIESHSDITSENISDQINDLIKKSSKLDFIFNVIDWVELFSFFSENFETSLIHPNDWFNFWQNNCRLASLHSYLTKSKDYQLENKWDFLIKGKEYEIPVSPYNDNIKAIVCKHINIEGGMGINFYKNAAFNGEWIIQECLENAEWLNEYLPTPAPLSTMRVITSSSYSLTNNDIQNSQDVINIDNKEESSEQDKIANYIKVESGVLRLGRVNAKTDHSSVLFDVNLETGEINKGAVNSNWYQLGLDKAWSTPWSDSKPVFVKHPDFPYPSVAGKKIPLEILQESLAIVSKAHYKLIPNVPFAGWDVAFTTKGIFLLEVNLSCNFFLGHFNKDEYYEFLGKYWRNLEKIESLQGYL